MKRFQDLTDQEVLALAVSLEEEDERIYADFADGLREQFAATASIFEAMQREESEHRRRLIELHRARFGEHIPLIRRQDVRGFVQRRPVWLYRPLSLETVRRQATAIEYETRKFYEQAAQRSQDASVRQLLGDLALAERHHEQTAQALTSAVVDSHLGESEDTARRKLFVMQVIQPGLAGLMDGSVSTLAPVFAAAAATKSTHEAFLVGLAASLGAGISMGFAEALSDDGALTGRGHPWIRGVVCGAMTTGGGIGHTLPFLIIDFRAAMFVALVVVVLELAAITWVRKKYMDTPMWSAALQVAVGGALVFATGILIGNA